MLNKLRYHYYRYKYRNAPKLRLTSPVDVSLELSSFCTNACQYCYHADPKKLPFTRGFMSEHMAKDIIKECAELGVNSLKFNWRGEATMNPNFLAITSYAKSLSSGSTFIDRLINTNFNFRNNREDIFQGLLNETKVKVSFDSFRKEIFEKQRKGSRYNETIANIHKFYNFTGRNNILVIQCVRTLLNKDEDFETEIKKRWPSAKFSVRDCVEGRVDKDLSNVIVKKRDDSERQSCIQAHARMIFHHDGRVNPCCPSIDGSLVIGKFPERSVKQIWNGLEAFQLRKDLLTGEAFKSGTCKTCPSFETYKGYKAGYDS